MTPGQRTLRGAAGVGLASIAISVAARRLVPEVDDPISRALLASILVFVPAALALLRARDGEAPYFRALAYLLPPAALLAAGSLFLERGPIAGAAASAWVVATTLVALLGVGRLRAASPASPEGSAGIDRAIAAATFVLPLGAVWLVLGRFGATPLGLSGLPLTLLALHLHLGGFVAPVLFSLAWQRAERTRRRLLVAAVCSVLGAVTTMAATLVVEEAHAYVALAGASLFGVAFLLHASSVIAEVGVSLGHRGARVLLTVAALAPILTSVLAGLRALGIVSLDLIVRAHGETNAWIAVGGALAAWALVGRRA